VACYGGEPGRHCRYHILNILMHSPLYLLWSGNEACCGGEPGRHYHCHYRVQKIELDRPLLLVSFNWGNFGTFEGKNGVPDVGLKIRI
jgi:hypothetical protein